MTEYQVRDGRLSFTVNLSDGTECYVEMDAPDNPEQAVADYIAAREAAISNDG